MIRGRVVLVVLAAAGLIAAGCAGDDEGDDSGENTTTAVETARAVTSGSDEIRQPDFG